MAKGTMEKSISVLDELNDWASTAGRTLMIDIDRRLVMETPVDTGAARRNWLASVDHPDNTVYDEDGAELGTASLQALEQGAAVISNARTYTRIYLSNNLPYIQRLNEGWSQQAPAGFVDAIIEQEVNNANRQ